MRLGIFGGSFDPVHYGHLLLAESCREQCQLEEVWWVPTASAPHKRHLPAASARHRTEMLQLALGGHDAMHVSLLEIERSGVSYTVDTLTAIRAARPDAELFLLLGADALADLPHWREPDRICALAIPVAVRRAGSADPCYEPLRAVVTPQRLAVFQQYQVTMPLVGLASSDIRARVAQGSSIRFRTPRAVEKYIQTHGLYR
jgi:nicotinate-nucleotide adenylyltransferase